MELLPNYQGTVALHVDLDFSGLVLVGLRSNSRVGGVRGSGHVGDRLRTVAGQEPAAAPKPDGGQFGAGRQVGLGEVGKPDGRVRPVTALSPVAAAPQARFQ